jgi:small conductance mechanosensitive channel
LRAYPQRLGILEPQPLAVSPSTRCRQNAMAAIQWRTGRTATFSALVWITLTSVAVAQEPEASASRPAAALGQDLSPASASVDVRPAARDDEISKRLQSVLVATGWFTEVNVRVEQGVVFLNGVAESERLKQWAGDLARNTQGVVAVANRMREREPSLWDFTPAWNGVLDIWRGFIRSLPLLAFALVILALAFVAGRITTRGTRRVLHNRVSARLLRSVIAHAAGALVFLAGVYIVLRVAGLTQLALTLVGGTGLIGLALGIAFRNITENFLASIFLSMQRPFETDDLVEIDGVTGYVQQLNPRTTILMNLDGNLVQIPNATVYKSNLRNFTTNSNRRESFEVGIGYDDPVNEAQEDARNVLAAHPAVLQDPEPAVLVDSLGRATVNLRIYFWLNGREHSWLKVRSSVIRLVKRAFREHGVSMPDEAREVIFPQGVPVQLQQTAGEPEQVHTEASRSAHAPADALDAPSTKAEAGLYSEAGVIEEQARQVRPLQVGENLLKGKSAR